MPVTASTSVVPAPVLKTVPAWLKNGAIEGLIEVDGSLSDLLSASLTSVPTATEVTFSGIGYGATDQS